jgi:peptidoglycan/xylan/chitin deacetylase (PgdA/CDA1 family)
MNRPAIARSRGFASLLVAGSLLASTLSPAVILSARPRAVTAAVVPSAQPAPDSVLAVAATGPQSDAAPVGRPDTTPRQVPDPPRTAGPHEANSGCATPPATVTAASVVSHGPRDQKVLALTFDDGWDPGNTMAILGTLERLHVNATFFPVGRAVQLFPSVWRSVAAAGFPIGDHSYDHRRMAGLCFDDQLAELTRPQGIFLEVLGSAPFAVMRPPYGAYDWGTRLAAGAAGDARVVTWDVDTRDWSGLNRFAIAKRALAGQEGSIVLMHTFVHATAAALPRIIAGYRARGFVFVTIGQLLGLGGPVPYP